MTAGSEASDLLVVDGAAPPSEGAPGSLGPQADSVRDAGISSPPSASPLKEEIADQRPVQRGGIKESVALIGGVNVLAFAGGIVRQKVFAVVLGPMGIGAFSLATAFLELLLNVCRFGAPTGLLREASQSLAEDETARAHGAFVATRRIAFVIGLIAVAVVAVVSVPLAQRVSSGALMAWMLPVIVLAVPFSVSSQLALTMINATGDVRRLAATKAVMTASGLVVSLVAVTLFGLEGAVVQLLLAAALGTVLSHVSLRRFMPRVKAAGHHVRSLGGALRRVYAVGGAEAGSHIAIALNLLLFRTLLVGRLGLAENGIYQGVMGLSRQYTVALAGAVFVFLYPRVAAWSERDDRREVRDSLGFLLAVMIPAALVLLVGRDVLVPLLLSDEFVPMVPLLGLSAPGDVLAVVIAMFQIVLLASGRTRAFLTLTVGGEVLYLALFLFGLSWFGLAGAVGSYLVWGCLVAPLAVKLAALPGPGLGLGAEGVRLLAGLAVIGAVALLPIGAGWSRVVGLVAAAAWLFVHRAQLQKGRSG